MDSDPALLERKFHSNSIRAQINKLVAFAESPSGAKCLRLHANSVMEVRVSREPLNTTLFFAGHVTDSGGNPKYAGTLLMGMLYAHKTGTESQLFKVPKGGVESADGLRVDLMEHFKKLFFERGKQVLVIYSKVAVDPAAESLRLEEGA